MNNREKLDKVFQYFCMRHTCNGCPVEFACNEYAEYLAGRSRNILKIWRLITEGARDEREKELVALFQK